jgi:hypothetical protein
MSIELEQIFEGAYFLQNGNKIRIKAEDFPHLPNIVHTLEPILVERAELSLLRFSSMGANTGTLIRSTTLGHSLWLKPGIGGKWFIGIEETLTTAYINYIHQLQRIYFSLFEEHLRYSVDEITPTTKTSNTYYHKPEHRVGSVVVESSNPRHKTGLTQATVTEPIQDELYYLTRDMRLLIRSKRLGYAIWEVVNHSPLFEFAGKQWGLKLAAGRTVTQEDTIAAGKWLLDLFSRSNIKFP